jgi:hypothetical protein
MVCCLKPLLDTTILMVLNIPYPALNYRSRGSPWSQRLTGVYHQLRLSTRRSSWIILQDPADTRKQFQYALERCDINGPMLLHAVILSSTEVNWVGYLEYLNGQLDDIVRLSVRLPAEHLHN